MSTIFAPMVAEVVSQPIIIITVFSFVSIAATSCLQPPEKIGDFASAGKKGKIKFVPDLDDGNEMQVDSVKNVSSNREKVNKELFLIEDEENEDEFENNHASEHQSSMNN